MTKASGPRVLQRGKAVFRDSPGPARKVGPGFFCFGGAEVLGVAPGFGAPRAAIQGLLQAGLRALGHPRAGLALRLVSSAQSRALNRRFRGLDRSTDILSFPASSARPLPGFAGHLGDLAFCPAYAWRKRRRFFDDHGEECAHLLFHGLLHLAGLHHDSRAQELRQESQARRLRPLAAPYTRALRRLGPAKDRL